MVFEDEWEKIVFVETGTFRRNGSKVQEIFRMKKIRYNDVTA